LLSLSRVYEAPSPDYTLRTPVIPEASKQGFLRFFGERILIYNQRLRWGEFNR
jgi:hypothetical protein